MIDTIKKLAEEYWEEIRDIRRHIHQNPELSFQEHETIQFIVSTLRNWGIEVQYPIADTGCIAIIHGKEKGSVRALRADIDALPILEKNECSYKSKNEGVMHACGHDVHTSCALGAAKILYNTRESWKGTVKILFQPAEEKLPGGASIMIQEGALKNPTPEKIIGQHVHPPLECGKIGIRAGYYMASADEIYLTVNGKGGHAALPHDFIDPILIASNILIQLQQIVSRKANPITPTVLSFGKIFSDGGATNIIPEKVHIEGTLRTMDESWRFQIHELIKNICESTAQSMGGHCDVDIRVGYPTLYNHPETTQKVKAQSIAYLGEENVIDLPIRMTAEDFAFYSQEIPACFYRLGTGNKELGITSPVHTPTFDIDENALKTGMGLMAFLATHE